MNAAVDPSRIILQAGGLAARVCEYFRKHPDEELDTADVALKFQERAANVAAMLSAAYTHGLLQRRSDRKGGHIYCAGSKLAEAAMPPPSAAPAPAASALPRPAFPTPPKPPRKPRAAPFDVTDIKVEADIPLPPVRHAHTDWPALFVRFTKAGMCSSPLPIAQRTAVTSAAKKYFTEQNWKYAVRAVSDTHIRIWRTE